MKELDIELVNRISEIKYKDLYIFRYLQDKMYLMDSEEEMARCAVWGGVNEELLPMEASDEKASSELVPFYESLCVKEVLFVGGFFRKNINGELYHTAMDPFIDAVDSSRYIMVEPVNEINTDIPVHTKNIYQMPRKTIVEGYGIDRVDMNDLRKFMEESFFPVIEDHYGEQLPALQKESTVTALQWSLALRRAYFSFYTEVLKRVSPKVIFYTHGTSRNGSYLYEAANSLNITCIEIDHGAIAHTRIFPEHARVADLHVSFSDLAYEIAQNTGVDNVVSTGKPGVIQKGLSYQGDTMPLTIVCVMSSCEKDLLNKACVLSALLPPEKFLVMYKKHSTEQWTDEDKLMVKEHPNLQIMEFAVDVYDIYKICHIIIGEKSTTLLEAIPYEHIKILINSRPSDDMFGENGRVGFIPAVIDNGEMILTETVEDMLEEILSYDRTGNYRPNGDIYWAKDAERKFNELIDRYTS